MVEVSSAPQKLPRTFSTFFLPLLIGWTGCVALSLYWNHHEWVNRIEAVAKMQGRTVFARDLVYRHWNRDLGGVYARVSSKIHPDSYLLTPDRDVTTSDGQHLTLINPYYMARMIQDISRGASETSSHLTGLRPIRPQNAGDPWENKALRSLFPGVEEVASVEDVGGGSSMRMMRPLRADADCLACHFGFQVGDAIGGISVSVPLDPIRSAALANLQALWAGHVLLWFIVSIGLAWGSRSFQKILVEIDTTRRNAEVANQAKSDFLANMSHELRTPLNAILGYASLMSQSSLNLEQRGHVRFIRHSGEMLLQLISDILDFSKIDSSRTKLEPIDFELQPVLEEVLDSVAQRAAEQGTELGFLIRPDVPELVNGDLTKLRQILVNLVGNAVKFTKRGEVSVTVCIQERRGDKGLIRFEVVDTGIGLEPGHVEKLFKAFTQVDSSSTRKYGGAGLGLAIAYRLCHLMGGELGVQSEFGRGATFWFTVLLEAKSVLKHSADAIPSHHGKRVLIVEHFLCNRLFLEKECSSQEMECLAVPSAQEALRVIEHLESEKCPLDLAIIDFQMPEMDGIQLGAAIHARPFWKDLPMVLLTSLSECGEGDRAKGMGFVGVLAKPLKRAALMNLLEQFLRRIPRMEAVLELNRPVLPELPVSQAKAEHLSPAALRILVAEDNPVNQKVVVRILEVAGYTVDLVDDGRKAIESFSRQRFDLILMDCQMPEIDGFEAVRQIRKLEGTSPGRRVPIVALTANAFNEDRERCLEVGMDDYLAKPFELEQLQMIVEKWLPKRNK